MGEIKKEDKKVVDLAKYKKDKQVEKLLEMLYRYGLLEKEEKKN